MPLRRQLVQGAACVAIFIAISCGGGPTGPAAPMLEAYLRLQTTLAEDAMDRVPADAAALGKEAEHLGAAGERIHAVAIQLQGASDSKAMRAGFGDVSDAVIAYVRTSNSPAGSAIRLVYCPMVEKSWVQRGTAVRNPYFGKEMLECGEVKGGL